MNSSHNNSLLINLTLLVGVLLMLIPFPSWVSGLEPYWIGLLVIYWSMETPHDMGINKAFIIGIIVDVLTGNILGIHSLGLIIIVFITIRFCRILRFFTMWQQAFAVMVLLLNDRLIYVVIQFFLKQPMPSWQFWIEPLVGMVLWPWLYLLMDKIRYRN